MSQGRIKKILLVEDESSIIDLVSMLLGKKGYEVVTVTDGSEALENIRREMPDLIILDIMLPNLNGFQVCQQIKTDENLKAIPILIVSALMQKEEIEMGMRMGAEFYLTKPFQNQQLLDAVRKMLSQNDESK